MVDGGRSDWLSQNPLPSIVPLFDRDEEARRSRDRRIERAKVVIPRLRAIGYAGLWTLVAAHNLLVFRDPLPKLLLLFALVELSFFALSKLVLVARYDPDAKLDLSDVFLAGDIPVFVMAVYASGGEQSWMLPVLCMRVADQVGTSPRRTRLFALITAIVHAAMVLYMQFGEGRQLDLVREFAKVLLVFVCNQYLALATRPLERQRLQAVQMAQTMRSLIDELQTRGAELAVQRERAESANQAKTAFLAHMSHEIRTPLTAVLGMSDLLLRQKLDAGQREIVEMVQMAGKTLHGLVNDVLDLSKVESGKLELELGDVDLGQVVQGAVEPLRVLAAQKHLQLQLQIDGIAGRRVRADALRLRQIISNLVGNAIKFTPAGSVWVRLRAREGTWTPGQSAAPELASSGPPLGLRVQFAVQDTGIGIAPEASLRVFEAFTQADASTTRMHGGTGLGLTISRKLVEMMGGELRLHSVPGAGSTFEFELSFPVVVEPSQPPSRGPGSDHAARIRALRPHVLVVEDVEVNRLLLIAVLQGLGCKVTTAEHGQRALATLGEPHSYDVVIMDWHMPVLDGIEATVQTRQRERAQRRKRTPIIGFTASAFAEDVARCREAGMDLVLHKPLVRAQLEEALYVCLSSAEVEVPA